MALINAGMEAAGLTTRFGTEDNTVTRSGLHTPITQFPDMTKREPEKRSIFMNRDYEDANGERTFTRFGSVQLRDQNPDLFDDPDEPIAELSFTEVHEYGYGNDFRIWLDQDEARKLHETLDRLYHISEGKAERDQMLRDERNKTLLNILLEIKGSLQHNSWNNTVAIVDRYIKHVSPKIPEENPEENSGPLSPEEIAYWDEVCTQDHDDVDTDLCRSIWGKLGARFSEGQKSTRTAGEG